jgi:hypothetical protein
VRELSYGELWKDKPKGRKEERACPCAKTEKLSCKTVRYLLSKNITCHTGRAEEVLNLYKYIKSV